MKEVQVKVNIVVETCYKCGIPFGMPDYHKERLLSEGGAFWCPNGHPQEYTNPLVPALEKKLKELERAKELYKTWYEAEQGDHEHTRSRLSATKGQVTKLRKRIANGVCPCCNRHFTNLERHISSKHPDYSAEQQED